MARKTFEVEKVRNSVNHLLAHTSDEDTEYRRGALSILEGILHDTGNYRGFRYLESEYAKPGDEVAEYATALRKDFDETRRHYH